MIRDSRLNRPALEDRNLLLLAMLLREVDRFPERVAAIPQQSGGALPAAVDVVQALSRAEGAVLYVVHDDRLALAVCTVDASRLAHVFETCQAALQSGPQASWLVRGTGGAEQAARLTFTAIPILRQGRVLGVLYLEGQAEISARVDALVEKCARVIARLLDRPERLAEMEAPQCAGANQVERQ